MGFWKAIWTRCTEDPESFTLQTTLFHSIENHDPAYTHKVDYYMPYQAMTHNEVCGYGLNNYHSSTTKNKNHCSRSVVAWLGTLITEKLFFTMFLTPAVSASPSVA